MTDKIEVSRELLEAAVCHNQFLQLDALNALRILLREAAQPNIGQRKVQQLIERNDIYPIGTILQCPGTNRRATVDDFGRVQWWAVDGSGMMVLDTTTTEQKGG